MTKELFVSSINALKKQLEHDNNFVESMHKAFPDTFDGNLLYNNSFLVDQILEILKTQLNDNGDWIEYFIYELDFGKKYKPGCATNADGSHIDISTAGKLYEFLRR